MASQGDFLLRSVRGLFGCASAIGYWLWHRDWA